MAISGDQLKALDKFAASANFQKSLLVLDLDGTALLEEKGKVFISSSVEKAVKAIHDLKLPVAINTLRFPLSVMRTVGEAWYQIAEAPILTILLNGSVLGYIQKTAAGLEYEELAAFPMAWSEVENLLAGVDQLLASGVEKIILFYYSRDWRAGETIWTPSPSRIESLKKKYLSASHVFAGPVSMLRDKMRIEEICMASLLIDRPRDLLMAYQHSKPSSFFTRQGVDKAFGVREIASRLNLSLLDSFGAGDTQMDNFLTELGLALIVGKSRLPYEGRLQTVRVADPIELGEAIIHLGEKISGKVA